ncbi:MAG: FHA domain-containing protein, partial [Planctomycetia bacterium]|nr:FHA domain-containing protein [Planctomycetia bacterium]
MSDKTTWVIGGDPDCDLVVDVPSVSRHHCRLSRRRDGSFVVEDLGSTNGTFVNGQRIASETLVGREDAVTLGVTVPMPWPAEPDRPTPAGVRVIRVGREPDNDVVIDSPEVSGHHARLVIAEGSGEATVEDLGSTNGTAVGSPDSRVTRATFRPGDVLYFGPVAVPAASFF